MPPSRPSTASRSSGPGPWPVRSPCGRSAGSPSTPTGSRCGGATLRRRPPRPGRPRLHLRPDRRDRRESRRGVRPRTPRSNSAARPSRISTSTSGSTTPASTTASSPSPVSSTSPTPSRWSQAIKDKAHALLTDNPDLDVELDTRRAKALGQLANQAITGSDGTGARELAIYVHHRPDQAHGIVEVENTGVIGANITTDQLADWCHQAGTKVSIRPVLDLDRRDHHPRVRPHRPATRTGDPDLPHLRVPRLRQNRETIRPRPHHRLRRRRPHDLLEPRTPLPPPPPPQDPRVLDLPTPHPHHRSSGPQPSAAAPSQRPHPHQTTNPLTPTPPTPSTGPPSRPEPHPRSSRSGDHDGRPAQTASRPGLEIARCATDYDDPKSGCRVTNGDHDGPRRCGQSAGLVSRLGPGGPHTSTTDPGG